MPKMDGTGADSLPPKVQGAQANQDKRAEGGGDDWTKSKGGFHIEASRTKPLGSGGATKSDAK